MPIYEYVCQDCGLKFEVIRSIREADQPMDCRKCHGKRTKRALSLFVAKSGERTVAGNGGCAGCSGGTCSSCHH